MEKIILIPSLKKRKELLKMIAKADSSWKFRMFLSACLFILAVSILLAIIILLFVHPTNMMGIFIFIIVGIIMSCVPFFIALSTKNKAKYKCAFPYSSYANGTLILDEQELQYLFWQVGPTEAAAYSSSRAVYHDEDKFVYKIKKTSISKLIIDEKGICTISGTGNIIVPEWADMPRSEIKEISKEFSFILAFDDEKSERIINSWRNNNGQK